jgi:hypothetical protein
MKTRLTLAILSILSVGILSCKKDNRTVPVQLLLTDNPAAYDSVNIHITGISVKIDKDEAAWVSIKAKDTTVNLLDLRNGTTTLIAQDNIPAGVLKEVRFILGPGSYVVVAGDRYELETPSAEDSGLKIKIDKHLSESLNSFVLDFDADLSIKEENGGYKLMPVIKLK